MLSRLPLFPISSQINEAGHLSIGGCDTVGLAAEFGTPLYLFDESNLRSSCAEFRNGFGRFYPDSKVVYACKAFINRALAAIFAGEGLGLDVVSAGELAIARSADFPMERIYFHGNNKSAEELEQALELGIGRIVVDNLHELKMLEEIAGRRGLKPDILLRLLPGVDPHTHRYISTGIIDSKFGFPLPRAEEAVAQAMLSSSLNLVGLHSHIGSLIFEVDPYLRAVDVVLDFAVAMGERYGFKISELNIGGGYAIRYTMDTPAPPVSNYAEAISSRITTRCRKLGLALPRLIVEPGRAIVGRSGVALYKVGAVKDIPGIRRYVAVDGGMGDNIRPALYEARYEAVAANRMNAEESGKVTIAGKFCESGDVLIRDIVMPALSSGDIVALPCCGAYCLPMASNYNASLKPAVVLVGEGKARLIRRRETFDDLTGCDLDWKAG
ncbi:MAG: diaminopimelate decarboxylase [Dehalococcoidales bacterium]|nr:diaminopimelate decarboxylase [Dehalococcoidales bacterium]